MKQYRKMVTAMTVMALAFVALPSAARQAKDGMVSTKLGGYVEERINGCIEKRVKAQDVDEIVNVFRKQDEVHGMWGSEFWGKWVQGAIASYQYTKDPALYKIIKGSVEKMISCQLKNGYIGNYDEAHQLSAWDVWGRKYTLLGLIKWYNLTGDKKALKSACRLLDYTLTQLGPGKKHVYEAGYYRGMPPMSILEPVVYLYNITGNKNYLDFAQYIVDDGETDGGPQLIKRQNLPVSKRFPVNGSKEWWSFKNGQKAYEMMSCYVGMLELYKVTGRAYLLSTVENVYRHILREEINVCGSGSAYECWYYGAYNQNIPSRHSMETCVTFTWMQLNEKLLELTGKSLYADQLERSMYNALMAAMRGDNGQIAKYIPLEGYRHEGENQCGIHINCCNANGPRAFAMIPRVAERLTNDKAVQVNFYIPSETVFSLNGQTVSLKQETNYPVDSVVELTVTPEKAGMAFSLQLRIPAWSTSTRVELNGKAVDSVKVGEYLTLNREWQAGDKIRLTFDMTGRLVERDFSFALERGPIVLARDTRFADGFVDECVLFPTAKKDRIALKPAKTPEGVWMAFEVPAYLGTYADSKDDMRTIHFCDFASAGNTWDPHKRYRVWLTKTLNVQGN